MATFYGTVNDDIIAAVNGDDFVYAGDGNDIIYDSNQTQDDDFYSGQKGDDFIFTYAGNDTTKGGTGNDTVKSYNQQDFSFDGGYGNDSIDFQVMYGHSVSFSYPTADRTVIKIIDDITDEVVQRITLDNVETISWFMVG